MNEEESKFGRRSQDKFFTDWIRPIIPWAIGAVGALVASAIGIWVRVAVIEATINRMQVETTTRVRTEQATGKDEKLEKLTAAIEKIIKMTEDENYRKESKQQKR